MSVTLPEGMTEISVTSSLDGTQQPNLFRPLSGRRPLLVGLHTWSHDRFNQIHLTALADKLGCHLLLPEFRGPNLADNPRAEEACGSRLAVRDVIDAVGAACRLADVDESAVLLYGASGGGHMALLCAAAAPERFRAVAVGVPPTDLACWYWEKLASGETRYSDGIFACLGGSPASRTEETYRSRSPLFCTEELARANVKVFVGARDPLIHPHHGLDLLAKMRARHPGARFYFDLFDGGHEMPEDLVEIWFRSQLSPASSSAVSG